MFDLVLGTPPALQEKVQEKDQDDADDDKGKVHSYFCCCAKICVYSEATCSKMF